MSRITIIIQVGKSKVVEKCFLSVLITFTNKPSTNMLVNILDIYMNDMLRHIERQNGYCVLLIRFLLCKNYCCKILQ